MNLGENIYRLRTQKNMSQGDLADSLEVSRQSVSKWENNAAVPELDKLEKLSAIFGVTLDELVHGEQVAVAVPTLSPSNEVPGHTPMAKNRLIGIILLICGFVSLIVMTVLGWSMGTVFLGVLIGFPLIVNGIVCLMADKHTLFVVCWVNYILLFILAFMVTINAIGDTVNPMVVISIVMLAALVAWSLYKLYKGHFKTGRIAKIVWTVILVLLLVMHLLMMLPTQSGGRVVTDDYSEEEYVHME